MNTSRNIFTARAATGRSSAVNGSFDRMSLSQKAVGPDSRLALNREAEPGKLFGRETRKVQCPDGEVEAIVMADDAFNIHGADSFENSRNPAYATPDNMYAWTSTAQVPTATAMDIPMDVSERLSKYMSLFTYVNCHMLVKMVCKMPLTESQRVYINWDSVDTISTTGVGFEWAPGERNEIYVLVPWSSNYPMRPYLDLVNNAASIFGYLSATPLGGDGGTNNISVYTTPVDLTCYNIAINATESSTVTTTPVDTYVDQQISFDKQTDIWISEIEVVTVDDETVPIIGAIKYDGLPLFETKEVGDPASIAVYQKGISKTPGTYGLLYGEFTGKINKFVLASTGPITVTPKTVYEQVDVDIEEVTDMKQGESAKTAVGHTPDNEHDEQPVKALGANKTQAVRETKQFYLVDNFSLSNEKPTHEITWATLPSELLLNYSRHRLWTKYPLLKLMATQNVSNPIKFRVTQVPPGTTISSYEQLLQLPGVEWDPKNGDLTLGFYWDRPTYAFTYVDSTGVNNRMREFLPTTVVSVINAPTDVVVPFNAFLAVDGPSFSAIQNAANFFPSRDEDCEEQIDTEPTHDNGTGMNIPGRQFQTAQGRLPVDEGAQALQDDFNYVDAFAMDVTEADPNPSVTMKLDVNALGVYARREAARHQFWRGNLRYRLLFQTPRTVAGVFTVAHVDTEPVTAYKEEVLRQFPHSLTQDNGAVDVNVGWRVETPWLKTVASDQSSNGLLYITFNSATGVTGTQHVRVTVYVDASDVEFARPTAFHKLPSRSVYMVPPRRTLPIREYSPKSLARSFAMLELPERDIQALVKAGLEFVQVGTGFYAHCPTCGLALTDWEEGDVPHIEHRRHSGRLGVMCPVAARPVDPTSLPLSLTARERLNACHVSQLRTDTPDLR